MLFFIVLFLFCSYSSSQTIVYNNLPSPIPPDVPLSISFSGGAFTQLGNYVLLNSTNNVTVCATSISTILSAHTARSDFPTYNATTNATINALGWYWNITVLIYSLNSTNQSYPAPNALLYSQTVLSFIPWRPANNGSCVSNSTWYANGTCYPGISFPVTWAFPSEVSLPANVLVAYTWNTQNAGFNPVGINGPWITLYLGIAGAPPAIGTNVIPGTEFVNSSNPGAYNSAGPTGVFRVDYGWSPDTTLLQVTSQDCPIVTTGVVPIVTTQAVTTQAIEPPLQHTETVVVVMIPIAGAGVAIIVLAIIFIYVYSNSGYTKVKTRKKRKTQNQL